MNSRVSSKGQVTVPLAVRQHLGLSPGTPVHFVVREGEAVIRKGGPGRHPVDAVYGTLRLARPVDALLDEMRGTPPRTPGTKKRRPRRTR